MKVLFAALLTVICSVPVHALEGWEVPEDDTVYLVDFASGEIIDNFYTFAETKNALAQYEEDHENLGIVSNGVIYYAEHAIVRFNTSEACDVNITYTNDIDDKTGFTNGCFGIDAAFIDMDRKGEKIEFMLSGVRGWASIEDVTIIPFENIYTRLTSYKVVNGTLYHEIKGQMDDDNYSSIINGGAAPSYLMEKGQYYSYDGHYFYSSDQLIAMLEDYRAETHEHAVNPEDPHYDYYQFVSHRTMSSATVEQLEQYFRDSMGLRGGITHYHDDDKDYVDDTLTRSQLYNTENAFYQYQYQYGANALMMLAIAANESSYGHSSLSFTRNNLYGHAAYDSDSEAELSRYANISKSIYSHAKYYISGGYASPLKAEFNGSFFGNKSAGMNVNYSSDPYWGEKAAAYYRNLDHMIGSQEENYYGIGIKTSEDLVYIYQYPEEDSKVLYSTGENSDHAFVILSSYTNEDGNWYKVQAEPTLNGESLVDLVYDYDFENNLGYVRQEDVQIVLPSKREGELPYVHITFDAAGGSFLDGNGSVTYAMPSGTTACADVPVKDHALFDHWDKNTEAITENTVFTAVYKDVDRIEITSMPKQDYELYDRIDLSGGEITVYFKDGSEQTCPMTTSMVSGYSLENPGESHVYVQFAGTSTEYVIDVSEEKDALRTEIKEEISSVIAKYDETEDFNDEQKEEILALKKKIDDNVLPYLTQSQLRSFDRILRKVIGEKIRYIVEDNDYGFGISGLSVSIPFEDALSKSVYEADTYRIKITKGVSEEADRMLNLEGKFLENSTLDTFTISISKNYTDIDINAPVLFTISKPEVVEEGEVFTVLYYAAETGDVEKCYTRQMDNTISFMGNHSGEYILLSRRTSNEYSGDDPLEAVTADTASYDLQTLLINITVLLVLGLLLIVIVWLVFRSYKKKAVRKERIKKKKDAEKAPAPPVDFTQAMHVFDTEVLNLADLENAEDEYQEEDYEYDEGAWYADAGFEQSNYTAGYEPLYSQEEYAPEMYHEAETAPLNQPNEIPPVSSEYQEQPYESGYYGDWQTSPIPQMDQPEEPVQRWHNTTTRIPVQNISNVEDIEWYTGDSEIPEGSEEIDDYEKGQY